MESILNRIFSFFPLLLIGYKLQRPAAEAPIQERVGNPLFARNFEEFQAAIAGELIRAQSMKERQAVLFLDVSTFPSIRMEKVARFLQRVRRNRKHNLFHFESLLVLFVSERMSELSTEFPAGDLGKELVMLLPRYFPDRDFRFRVLGVPKHFLLKLDEFEPKVLDQLQGCSIAYSKAY